MTRQLQRGYVAGAALSARVAVLAAGTVIAAAAALAACTSAPATAPLPQPTRQVRVSPVAPDGSPAAGYRIASTVTGASCEPGSEAIGQAYRCVAGNRLYDPCWAARQSRPAVVCLAVPWSKTVTRLELTGSLPALPPQGTGKGEPWGVQLAGGQRCDLLQGAHSTFGGRVIDYECNPELLLLRGLDQAGSRWRARSVVSRAGGALSAGPAEEITIAWYGSPDTFR